VVKLLRMPFAGAYTGDTIHHRGKTYLVNNQSLIAAVDDETFDFMVRDGRSGCLPVEDPIGPGELIDCPCCRYRWRRQPKKEE